MHARLLVIADGGASLGRTCGRIHQVSRLPAEAIVACVETSFRTATAHSSASPPTVRLRCCRSKTAMRWSGPRRRKRQPESSPCRTPGVPRTPADAFRRPRRALPVRCGAAHGSRSRCATPPIPYCRALCCSAMPRRRCIRSPGQGFNLGLARCVGPCADLLRHRGNRRPRSAGLPGALPFASADWTG